MTAADEFWYECGDCEEGTVFVPDGEDESVGTREKCPDCDGRGVFEGTAEGEALGFTRVYDF